MRAASFIQARLASLFSPPTKVEVLGDAQCRVDGLNYRQLSRCLARLPGLRFPRKPRYFWLGSGTYAEFVFRSHAFVIEADLWDGALWICSKDKQGHAEEIQEIREHLEKHARSA